jgi:hypothetical protein
MTIAHVLEVAHRNLLGIAHLDDAEFWREYARIEDAALLCIEPEHHGAVMQELNACLIKLGKVAASQGFA